MVCLLDISESDLLCSEDNALDTALACLLRKTSSLGRLAKTFCRRFCLWNVAKMSGEYSNSSINFLNYITKPSSCKSNFSRRRNLTGKLRDRCRIANAKTQDSIHVHPMWLAQSVNRRLESMARNGLLEAIITTKLSVRLVRGSVHLS